MLRRHASWALLSTPMRESPRSRCVSIANDHHNVNPSSRRLLAHRGDGDGRLATLWGPFGDPCCIGPWASWWPIIAPLASLDVRWTIWDTNQLAANRYMRSMMPRGAGGGPGGGARVRLARGSRVLRIPRVHRRSSPNSARHHSGRFELFCDLGTVSWGWRRAGRAGWGSAGPGLWGPPLPPRLSQVQSQLGATSFGSIRAGL